MQKTLPRKIRRAEPADLPKLSRLYAQTVQAHGPGKYSIAQIEAWSNAALKEQEFASFILDAETWISEDELGPTGFAGLKMNGHISSLYVREDCVRQGIGNALLNHLLQRAKAHGISKVHTEASQFSKALFAKNSFVVVEEETIDYDGVDFLRWKMERSVDLA